MIDNLGISVIGFHTNIGPYAMYAYNIDIEHAQNIGLKSMLIQGSMASDMHKGESILSFPSLNLAIFITMNYAEYKEGVEKYPVIIGFSTDLKYQFLLYKYAVNLSHAGKQIFQVVCDYLNQKQSTDMHELKKGLPSFITKLITKDWVSSITTFRLEDGVQKSAAPDPEPTIQESYLRDLKMVNQIIKKNFHHAIFDIIVGEQVVVVSEDKYVAQSIINALSLFAPHRDLNIIPWVDSEESYHQMEKNWDIIGVPEALSSTFKKYDRVSVKKSKVFGGRSNVWCQKLLEEVLENEGKKFKLLQLLIKRRIDWILVNVSSLMKVIETEDDQAIESVTTKLDKESLFMVSYILETLNPIAFRFFQDKYSLRSRIFRGLF